MTVAFFQYPDVYFLARMLINRFAHVQLLYQIAKRQPALLVANPPASGPYKVDPSAAEAALSAKTARKRDKLVSTALHIALSSGAHIESCKAPPSDAS